LKRNPLLRNWEEYFACLSGGYIYFFLNSSDEEYFAYYYIKDCDIISNKENLLVITLKNSYGIVEIKFPNEEKMKKWMFHLNERIDEMKYAYNAKAKELDIINKSRKVDSELIYFGMEININNANIDLFNEHITDKAEKDYQCNFRCKKLFELKAKNLKFILNMREFDIILKLYLRDFILLDCFELKNDKSPKLLLKSVNNNHTNKDAKKSLLKQSLNTAENNDYKKKTYCSQGDNGKSYIYYRI